MPIVLFTSLYTSGILSLNFVLFSLFEAPNTYPLRPKKNPIRLDSFWDGVVLHVPFCICFLSLIFVPMLFFIYNTDRCGVETYCEETRSMENSALSSSPVRCWHRNDHFCPDSHLFLVSFHIHLPDPTSI